MGELVDSLEERARRALREPVFRYFRQGARDGVSAAEATAAWDRFRFLPHVLGDVTAVDTTTSLLGASIRSPFAVAPTTLQRAAHRDGEIAMARAVAAAGSLMVVSSNAGSTFEEIGGTGVAWWLQMYVAADRATGRRLVRRAAAAGATAVVLTADTPVVATKYDQMAQTVWDIAEPDWLRVNFEPGYGSAPGDEKATDLGPGDVEALAADSGLPVVVKGVLRADDARRCVDAGASAVWVSNHGGRQLDFAAATADALEAVVQEVAGTAEVYVDGGVRCARHALVALALGARATFLGRLPLYALAVGGEGSVHALLDELRADLAEAMMLAGRPDVACVGPDLLTAQASSDRLLPRKR